MIDIVEKTRMVDRRRYLYRRTEGIHSHHFYIPDRNEKITGEEGNRMKSNINDGIISAIMLAVTTAAGTAVSYGIKKMAEAIASKKGGK